MAPLLTVENVTKEFSGIVANKDVNFEINEGEIVSLIGPNGAGKTTMFSMIAGALSPSSGSIVFNGEEISKKQAFEICHLGIARTFQVVRVLKQMTVLENVIVGALSRTNSVKIARGEAENILKVTGLYLKKDYLGKNLTLADMKRLEVAKALATKPKLLLLDEVMAGLTPVETNEAVELLREIHGMGITLFIVEHVMEAIMPVSDRIIVLDAGKKIAEGSPEEVVNDERVIKAYLGDRYHARS